MGFYLGSIIILHFSFYVFKQEALKYIYFYAEHTITPQEISHSADVFFLSVLTTDIT
jgi:hypothetical protein